MAGRRIARSILGTPRGVTVRQDLLEGALSRCWGGACTNVFVMENRRTRAVEALQQGARASRRELNEIGRTARAFAGVEAAPPAPDLLRQLYARAPVAAPAPLPPPWPGRTGVGATPAAAGAAPRGRPPQAKAPAPAAPAAAAPPTPPPAAPPSSGPRRRGRPRKEHPQDAIEQLSLQVFERAARGETLVEDPAVRQALRAAAERLKNKPDLQAKLALMPPEVLEPPPPAAPAAPPVRTLSPAEIRALKLRPPLSAAERAAEPPRRAKVRER